jgi:asparagine synthase (glutamine-hydrolysing)
MCGIVGVVRVDADPADIDAITKGLESLDHRGPDAHAVRRLDGSGLTSILGHSRLRIIDLSPDADQPLPNEDETVWVAYNGELYDEPEARRLLLRQGHRFRSRSDTEILVHLYEEHIEDPPAMLDELRGMFAFALVDTKRGRVLLARDRLGIKPMYWSVVEGGVAFASEVGAFIRAGFAKPTLDRSVLGDFLLWGHTRTDRVFVPGVHELAPGHSLLWDKGEVHVRRWWQPEIDPQPVVAEEAERLLRAVLDDSVGRHLVADRPVGVFLSGGVDSGAVVARAAARGDVRTFTVSFPEVAADEGPAASLTAMQLGVSHDEVPVTGGEIAAALPHILRSMDRPTADGINTWLVCRAAREGGLVVALSGLGGDELFGGYPSFRLVPQVARARFLTEPLGPRGRATVAAWAGRRSPGSRASRMLGCPGGFGGAYSSVRCQFSPAELHAAGVPGLLDVAVRGDDASASYADRVALMELANYMPEQLLRDTDQMSMAHSLEVRVPILDDVVVRVALAMPAPVRMRGRKQLLADAARVPSTRKRPFSLPFDLWMRGPLAAHVREGLLSDALPFSAEIPRAFRVRLLDAFERNRTHWSRPWTVAVLRLWAAERGFSLE